MKRGFTLVEVLICIALVGILALPLAWLGGRGYAELVSVSMRHDAKQAASRAASRIFALSQEHGRIDADNHGLQLGEGAWARWRDRKLELRHHGSTSVLLEGLDDFTATRASGRLCLNFEWSSPNRPGGPSLRRHEIFEEGQP